jgi:hypothetical protein
MTRARDLADFNFDGKAVTINESSADLDFRVESDNLDDALFVQGSDGIVGVGTKTPAVASGYGMQIHNDSSAQTRLVMTNSDTGSAGTDGFQIVVHTDTGAILELRESADLRFATGATERMRLDSSGNLLVGTTTNDIFDSSSEVGSQISDGYLAVARASTVAYFNRLTSDGEVVDFRKGGSSVGSIKAGNGDLLIGTGVVNLRFFDATPAVIPRTASDGTSNGVIDLGNTSNHFQNAYFTGTVFAESFTGRDDTNTSIQMAGSDIMKFFTGGTERFRVDDSGHLNYACTTISPGLGNTDTGIAIRADSILAVSSASGYVSINRNGDGTRIQFNNSGNTRGTITVTGTTTAYNTSSDRRLKSNIQDAASASSKIDAMKVRQFDWTEDGKHQDYGMIAQELQSIEPLAVSGSEDSTDMMGVDYSKLVPMLIKEIQELRGRVATLEAS